MKVFKFGGASVSTVERIQHVPGILSKYAGDKLVIIISAMGKTTNALEEVVNAFYAKEKDKALELFQEIKNTHLTLAASLLPQNHTSCHQQLIDYATEAEWLLYDAPVRSYDYYYDQIVCVGELFSTTIISHYLNQQGCLNTFLDVRDLIRTDANFRDANINWDVTSRQVQEKVSIAFNKTDAIITQGFIGCTDDNESTTLGREGSDFTAAVIAHILDAESQTIWKDVPSVMNADPKLVEDAIPLPELNYDEVIEMAYYGAQVIHPKTIKPLENKSIPLYVKCFLDPSLPGTVIHNNPVGNLPPIIVFKENQIMIEMVARDFSFVSEHHIHDLYTMLHRLNLRPNLTQNGAIRFICVLDNHMEKIEQLRLEATALFDVQITKPYTLLTIRHYTKDAFEKYSKNRVVVIQQRTMNTVLSLLQ